LEGAGSAAGGSGPDRAGEEHQRKLKMLI
jgi:hypothetical protein